MKNPRKILLARRTADFFCYLYRIAVRGILRRERLTFAHKLDRMELRFLSETIEKERNRD